MEESFSHGYTQDFTNNDKNLFRFQALKKILKIPVWMWLLLFGI